MHRIAILGIRGLFKSLTISMGNNHSDACFIAKPTNKHSCTWLWQRTGCLCTLRQIWRQIQVISNANTDALLPQAMCIINPNILKRGDFTMDHSGEQPASRYRLRLSWQHSSDQDGMPVMVISLMKLPAVEANHCHSLFLTSCSLWSVSNFCKLFDSSFPPKSLLSIFILNWSRCCWTSSRQEVKHKGLCICVCVCVWMLVSEISLSVQELSSQHNHNSLSNFLSCLNPNCWVIMYVSQLHCVRSCSCNSANQIHICKGACLCSQRNCV